ncbi:Na+/H+ antiporter NhaA [Actinomadura craniellae]|uniref:Na(+)/H(+) antiporter NhaA n=1 Tax=Actinomadura craniellae TaxID=2231787 RepID=A0A365H3W8_9ACTN|nr:Na+/H+ antiporter NhaA [Actinomadura craniellae]RAY13797.1 Na+/H+ antiporter NhaA [Actinomadura craniellae]
MAGQTLAPPSGVIGRPVEPLRRFLRTESGSAALLLAATVVALLWANSPWSGTYETFWHTEFEVRLGDASIALDLRHWVNDGLMVFFFFVVGLEVKRELAMGELTEWRRAAVPLIGAVTGLLLPAMIFLALNPGGEAARAWGVVISTDTAFLLGILAVVGPARATALRIFLLTLAVADDVGALLVIALFYTEELRPWPLLVAALGMAVMAMLRRLQVWRGPAYFVVAIVVWVAMYESGVHPTVAGVVIALFVPVHPPGRREVEDAERLTHAFRQSPSPELARAARLGVERAVSLNERLQRLYHPWTGYVIVPIFALANAGVHLDARMLSEAMRSPLTWGIIAGLVAGKPIGIMIGSLAATRLGIGRMPHGMNALQLAGGAALSGIGFTISLFIVDLALDDPLLADEARVGVLAASVLATLLGWALFLVARRPGRAPEARPTRLDPPVDPRRDHVRGPAGAPLTLVEYGDFECPFCGQATGSVEEVREYFGDRLRYVFRHLPLTDVHPHAELAAQAAEAAAAQGRFWEMHDLLFAHGDRLDAEVIYVLARELDLDLDEFEADMWNTLYASRILEDVESAGTGGAQGTPTFFVNGHRHAGPFDAATLIRVLEEGP